jgi:hypothetical protein
MNKYIIKVTCKDSDNDEMIMKYFTISVDLETAIQEVTTVVNGRIEKFGGELISVVQDV